MELLQRLADTLGVNGTILFQWIIFVSTIFILYVFLIKPTVAYLDEREDKMKETGDEYDGLRAKIDGMTSDYDKKIKSALVEAGEVRTRSRRDAMVEEEKILEVAKVEANKTIEEMRTDLESVEQEARQELEKDAEKIADMILDRLLS